MLIYPNSMTFDIMDGGGIPPPPQGMLTIKVLRGDKLGSAGIGKIDPFVEVSSTALFARTGGGRDMLIEAAAMPLDTL